MHVSEMIRVFTDSCGHARPTKKNRGEFGPVGSSEIVVQLQQCRCAPRLKNTDDFQINKEHQWRKMLG